MSRPYYKQVQYVAKDQFQQQSQQPQQQTVNRNKKQFSYHESYQRKSNKYPRRNYSNDKKQVPDTEHKQPTINLNQPQQCVYDQQTLLSKYKEKTQPDPTLNELISKIPNLFSKTPLKPVLLLDKPLEEEDPEWMMDSDFVATFEIKDIEQDIEAKRVEYQKAHGTFERKMEERKVKEEELNKQKIKQQQFEQEKLKYQTQKQQQQQQQNSTEAKLNELFNFQKQVEAQNNEKKIDKFLTLEEVEKNLKEPTSSKTDDSTDDLEAILGLKIGESSSYQVEPPPNQRIVPLEQIKKSPFTTQATLCKRQNTDPLWFYIDRRQQIQGGFPSKDMDVWYQTGYLMPELLISWTQPGKWIYLEQFIQNLEQVSQGKLGENKAMEPKFDYQTQLKYQQQQQQKMRQYYNMQYQQQYQQYQQYQYNQQYQQKQQKQNNNTSNRPIFNIGAKKNESYTTQASDSTSGYVIDNKDFPSFNEQRK